ncbi:phospholipase A1-Igamma1, chloroplastic-like [Apium graveolens]|uniref:phospholipase A1-Igamma1, chloroplastic-like n=1 Tax=Apium graveolens TaxID=4045 RepID=UPI003D7A41F1
MDFQRPVTHRQIYSRDPSIRVEAGFLQLYTDKDERCKFSKDSAREQVLAELSRLIQKYENEEMSITITGHSLGGALAILNAYDIAETGVDFTKDGRGIPVSVCVFSFSGPRVGNGRFKERLEGLGVKLLRVVNIHDKVPYIPGVGEMSPWCYSHVGEELALDHENSTFLKKTNDLGCCHNLEALLHLIDGLVLQFRTWTMMCFSLVHRPSSSSICKTSLRFCQMKHCFLYHGKDKRFWLSTGRDIALVNKSVKDDYSVVPNWWGSRDIGKNVDHVSVAGET